MSALIHTEAWVLREGPPGEVQPAELELTEFSFADLGEDEVLFEPLYGCWEGNMSHAIRRSPIDVCRARGEPAVVLGNSGVVRVLRTGKAVENVREGDVCIFFGAGAYDAHGYVSLAHAYDAPNTVGLLARQAKVWSRNLFKVPSGSPFSLRQWAAFSVRYFTAWSNWRVAHGCFRLQLSEDDMKTPHVWGWGGGTTLAELQLARLEGCEAVMISGTDHHLAEIRRSGIFALDRRALGLLEFDGARFASDDAYRAAYLAGEQRFIGEVERITGRGVSIFADYIGSPYMRLTLKALGRHGVLTTAGWMLGMHTRMNRAAECIKRRIHVFTHFARFDEAQPAIDYAEEKGWIPADDMPVYAWQDVPKLAREFTENKVTSYFPLFEVNRA